MPSPAPRLTVLIAAWEAAASIERALDSVLVERGIDLECIVVDDGSTDGTADVVRAVAARDARVTLVALPENVGVSAARNAGLGHVHGEWLTFLDADDRLLPGAIAALMAPTADPSVRVVIGQRIWTDGVRTWIASTYDNPDVRRPGRKSLVTSPGLLYYASGTGKVFHRSVRDGLRFTGRVLGDQPWTIRALLRAGPAVEVIADTVYEWDRPRPDDERATITADKARSTARAVEMVRVAQGAWSEVAAEADAVLADPAARHVVRRAYLDRLLRADIRGALDRAITRHDVDTGQLVGAVLALLASVAPETLADSHHVGAHTLRPILFEWRRLDRGTRATAWQLVDLVLRVQPQAVYAVIGLPTDLPRAPARAVARAVRTRPGQAVALSLLVPLGIARAVARWAWRRVKRVA